jgi:hypothetical protein
LHITLDQITCQFAKSVSSDERADLAAALKRRMSGIAPFTVQVGSMLSHHSGGVADLSPDGPLTALHQAVRETIRTVRGADATRYPWSTQHLTIAYANGEADSDQAQRLLRRVRPGHAPLHISAIHLVDVAADAEAKTITWQNVATIPLGPAATPAPPPETETVT